MSELAEKCCRTCRWWDVHSFPNPTKGTCRAKQGNGPVHRFSRVPMGDGSYALLDSFEPVDTLPSHRCGAWQQGQPDGPIDVREHAAALRAAASMPEREDG